MHHSARFLTDDQPTIHLNIACVDILSHGCKFFRQDGLTVEIDCVEEGRVCLNVDEEYVSWDFLVVKDGNDITDSEQILWHL